MKIKQWINQAKLAAAIMLMLPFLVGCWDRLEIEERAVVLGISVDAAGPEAEKQEREVSHIRGKFPVPKKEMIRVAAQIGLPGRIPLGPGEGGGQTGGGGQNTVWVIEVVGHSIDDALMNLQQQISGRLFFGHLRVIVVSEEVAKRGMENLNDFFRRNSEVRRMAWIMISKGKAEPIMKAAPKLERVPSLYLMSTLDEAVRMGKFPADYIGLFWSDSSKKGKEAYLPYIALMKEQNVELAGIAYFKGDKMVGVTKPFEIAAYMAIKGMNPAGYRSFVRIDDTQNVVNLYATYRRSKINVAIKDGRPHFVVKAFIEVNLEEKSNERDTFITPALIEKLERQDEQAATKFYKSLIAKTQEKGSDIFGFGEYVRGKEPRFWNQQVKSKERWQEMYKDSTVDVQVNIEIRRVGMKAR
ncbi:Ger(x)C family spore germination protein [Brevibacillus choshinensis]|uniref:Ger(X)C family spore germination protein n=1 Tax=Brevibacillus choshinensis TaxID=54911 RepID=A0ABX7FKM2_BRECH|nr:Ger(x)C family spore germination protein [Brevibacillus choshinensis]QRG65872.1 Ger(x)C family spore germination protein [Brevibacillus choshinensis]